MQVEGGNAWQSWRLTLQIRSGQVLMEEIGIQGSRLLHLDVRHQKGSPSELSVDPKKVDAD